MDRNNNDIGPRDPGQVEPSHNLEGGLREREDLSGLRQRRKWSLFACSCLLQFLLQLDMASVAVVLPV